MIKISSN